MNDKTINKCLYFNNNVKKNFSTLTKLEPNNDDHHQKIVYRFGSLQQWWLLFMKQQHEQNMSTKASKHCCYEYVDDNHIQHYSDDNRVDWRKKRRKEQQHVNVNNKYHYYCYPSLTFIQFIMMIIIIIVVLFNYVKFAIGQISVNDNYAINQRDSIQHLNTDPITEYNQHQRYNYYKRITSNITDLVVKIGENVLLECNNEDHGDMINKPELIKKMNINTNNWNPNYYGHTQLYRQYIWCRYEQKNDHWWSIVNNHENATTTENKMINKNVQFITDNYHSEMKSFPNDYNNRSVTFNLTSNIVQQSPPTMTNKSINERYKRKESILKHRTCFEGDRYLIINENHITTVIYRCDVRLFIGHGLQPAANTNNHKHNRNGHYFSNNNHYNDVYDYDNDELNHEHKHHGQEQQQFDYDHEDDNNNDINYSIHNKNKHQNLHKKYSNNFNTTTTTKSSSKAKWRIISRKLFKLYVDQFPTIYNKRGKYI